MRGGADSIRVTRMLSGDVFGGRYQIIGTLGQGGAGRVYRARDTTPDREVALKVLTSSASTMPERFLREARAAARLRHPGIVTIYDFGVAVALVVSRLVSNG
jgi:serine/threonine protein kinase